MLKNGAKALVKSSVQFFRILSTIKFTLPPFHLESEFTVVSVRYSKHAPPENAVQRRFHALSFIFAKAAAHRSAIVSPSCIMYLLEMFSKRKTSRGKVSRAPRRFLLQFFNLPAYLVQIPFPVYDSDNINRFFTFYCLIIHDIIIYHYAANRLVC